MRLSRRLGRVLLCLVSRRVLLSRMLGETARSNAEMIHLFQGGIPIRELNPAQVTIPANKLITYPSTVSGSELGHFDIALPPERVVENGRTVALLYDAKVFTRLKLPNDAVVNQSIELTMQLASSSPATSITPGYHVAPARSAILDQPAGQLAAAATMVAARGLGIGLPEMLRPSDIDLPIDPHIEIGGMR